MDAQRLRVVWNRYRDWPGYLLEPPRWAIRLYRFAHAAHQHHWPLLPDVLTCVARVLTDIELSYRAEIGQHVCIMHGQGVVVGSTSVIGDGGLIFQGVTLGARRREDDNEAQRVMRVHPILGREVMVSTNAVLLGAITMGDGAIIGANAVVLTDVPPGYTAVGNPARLIPPVGRP